MTTPGKGRIFINYRRADSAGYAGRIYDRLTEHFGEDAIFMDVDVIPAGVDFVETLQNAVQSCDVLVALMGRSWLSIKDETGERRLDNPEDFVRVEIAAAPDRDIRVIPILVDGVPMPRSTELPRNLKPLARRNALQVNHHSFNPDVYRLIEQVELALKAAEDSKILKAKAEKEAQERAQRQAEIERSLKAADLAISLQDWNMARLRLNQVLKLDSDHAEAQDKLGIVQRKISEIEQERTEQARKEKAARKQAAAEEHARLTAGEKKRIENKKQADHKGPERPKAEERTYKQEEQKESLFNRIKNTFWDDRKAYVPSANYSNPREMLKMRVRASNPDSFIPCPICATNIKAKNMINHYDKHKRKGDIAVRDIGTSKIMRERIKLLGRQAGENFIGCPVCNTPVKGSNLVHHYDKRHKM